MLQSIRMVNYRQYSDKTISFNPQLNVIQGRNGTGKSTIVEAIGYALQGSQMQKGKAKDWIKDGQNTGYVVLEVDDFIITRGTNLQQVEDTFGNVLATGHTGLNSWIESYYGLTLEAYKTSYHIGQKEISSFAALSSMERTKRVEKLLRIDVIDELKQVAQNNLRTRKTQFVELDNKLKSLGEYKEIELASSIERSLLTDQIIESYRVKMLEQERAYGLWVGINERWTTKQTLLKRTENYTIDALNSELANLKELKEKQLGLEQIIKSKMRFDKLEKKLASINICEDYFNDDVVLVLSLKDSYDKSKKAREELRKLSDDLQNLPDCDTPLEILKNQLAEAKGKLRNLEGFPDTCPTCGSKMPDNSTLIASLKEEVEILRGSIEVANIMEKYQKLNDQLVPGDDEDLTLKIDSLVNKADYIEFKRLEKDLEAYGEIVVDDKDYDSLISNVNAILKDFVKLEDYIEVENPGEFEVIDYSKLIATEVIKLNELKAFIKDQEQIKLLKDTYSSDRDKLEITVKKLQDFVAFIASYRKSFSGKVLPLLEDNAGKIVSYLSEGKITNFSLNEDYSVDGYDKLSGSEEDSADFAVRLAVAQIARLGSYNTMVLDEVAASFDSVKENKLLDILKATQMQLIYISHGDITV